MIHANSKGENNQLTRIMIMRGVEKRKQSTDQLCKRKQSTDQLRKRKQSTDQLCMCTLPQ